MESGHHPVCTHRVVPVFFRKVPGCCVTLLFDGYVAVCVESCYNERKTGKNLTLYCAPLSFLKKRMMTETADKTFVCSPRKEE